MHDSQIEERLRKVLRTEGDDLGLTITPHELERRLALRRRARAGQRLRLVAAGIAVISIGWIVAAGNGWLGGGGAQVVGGKPGPITAAPPSASAITEPTPPELTSPTASGSLPADELLPCDAIDPTQRSQPPAVGGGASPGDSLGHGGTVVATLWNGTTMGMPGTWDGLPDSPDAIVIGPTAKALQVVSDGCFQSISAEALLTVYGQAPMPSPTPIQLAIVRGGADSRVADIAPPPTGGWTLRVRAAFVTTDGSAAWSESLFRVFVPFDTPKLLMIQGPTTGEWSSGGCPSYRLASGASASDQCGAPYEPIADSTEPLTIVKGSSVVFELADAWRIDQAHVVAVDAALIDVGSFAPEYSVALEDKGGLQISVPVDLDPGRWIVRVSLNGSRAGDAFGAYYDLPLIVTPLS